MVWQSPQARVCSGFKSLVASSCVAQLEAEIAQLKEALSQRQRIGVATGCWPGASRSLLSRPGRSLSMMPTTKTVALLTRN